MTNDTSGKTLLEDVAELREMWKKDHRTLLSEKDNKKYLKLQIREWYRKVKKLKPSLTERSTSETL